MHKKWSIKEVALDYDTTFVNVIHQKLQYHVSKYLKSAASAITFFSFFKFPTNLW